VRRGRIVAAAAGAAALALPAIVTVHHHHPWDAVPGFHAVLGALGCALLVGLARVLGRLLERPEGWYDEGGG
jgi:hypothetical protein